MVGKRRIFWNRFENKRLEKDEYPVSKKWLEKDEYFETGFKIKGWKKMNIFKNGRKKMNIWNQFQKNDWKKMNILKPVSKKNDAKKMNIFENDRKKTNILKPVSKKWLEKDEYFRKWSKGLRLWYDVA